MNEFYILILSVLETILKVCYSFSCCLDNSYFLSLWFLVNI